MREIVEYMEWLVDLGTITSGFSTLVIAGLTFFLWRENRALRKAGSEPKMVAHFEIHPGGSGAIDISLSNVGTGPARDVSFNLKTNDDFQNYSIDFNWLEKRSAITLIPQGHKLSFHFAMGFSLMTPNNIHGKSE